MPNHGSEDTMGGVGPGACVMHAVGPGIDLDIGVKASHGTRCHDMGDLLNNVFELFYKV